MAAILLISPDSNFVIVSWISHIDKYNNQRIAQYTINYKRKYTSKEVFQINLKYKKKVILNIMDKNYFISEEIIGTSLFLYYFYASTYGLESSSETLIMM